MKVVGKTLNEHIASSWRLLAAISIITAIIVVLRLISNFPSRIQSVLVLGGVVFVGLAGWSVVRKHGFNLKQAAFVGFLLSFGTNWSVPIFHRGGEVPFLVIINSTIFCVIAAVGGWLAKRFKS